MEDVERVLWLLVEYNPGEVEGELLPVCLEWLCLNAEIVPPSASAAESIEPTSPGFSASSPSFSPSASPSAVLGAAAESPPPVEPLEIGQSSRVSPDAAREDQPLDNAAFIMQFCQNEPDEPEPAWEASQPDPLPQERMEALDRVLAELKAAVEAAHEAARPSLGEHIKAVCAERRQIELSQQLPGGWREADVLAAAETRLARLEVAEAAEQAGADDGWTVDPGALWDEEEDEQPPPGPQPAAESLDSQSADSPVGEPEPVVQEEAEDELEALGAYQLVPFGQQREAREMGRGGWSGRTVKAALAELLKTHYKGTRAKYSTAAVKGRWLQGQVTITGGNSRGPSEVFCSPGMMLFEGGLDAQNCAALAALWTKGEPRLRKGVQRTLPGFYAKMWAEWAERDCEEQQRAVKQDDQQMRSFVDRLLSRAAAANAIAIAGAGGEGREVGVAESWEDDDWGEESEPVAEWVAEPADAPEEADCEDGRKKQIRSQNRKMQQELSALQATPEFKKMRAAREELPMWGARKELIEAISNKPVVLVVGDTGCGKSTQVPQFLLDHMIETGQGTRAQIVCTQPRRIAAIGVAERTAAERTGVPGDAVSRVGYHIRLEAMAHPTATKLLFCTTGILLRRLQSEPNLESVSHVVIDEVHERDLNIDFLLLVLKDLLTRRDDLKVILMSATFNDKLLSDYFKDSSVVRVSGRMFPVEELYLEDCIERTGHQVDPEAPWALHDGVMTNHFKARVSGQRTNVIWDQKDQAANPLLEDETLSKYQMSTKMAMAALDPDRTNHQLIEELAELEFANSEIGGGILIFMSGLREIHQLYDRLSAHRLFGDEDLCMLVALHSSVSPADQRAIFVNPPLPIRKVVIATNIAETSVTIDNIVCVIDSGKAKVTR